LVLPVLDLVIGAVVAAGVAETSGAEDPDPGAVEDPEASAPSCRVASPHAWSRAGGRARRMSCSNSLESRSEEDAGVFLHDGTPGPVPGPPGPTLCRAVGGLEGPREDVADDGWCGADRCRCSGDPDADSLLLSEVSVIRGRFTSVLVPETWFS
jgi:hypothetical protein